MSNVERHAKLDVLDAIWPGLPEWVQRDDEMPIDESLLHRDIDPDTRAALLDYGAIFEDLIDAARAWEAARPKVR